MIMLFDCPCFVDQETNVNTGVVISARKGVITTQKFETVPNGFDSFVVTNRLVHERSHIQASIISYSGKLTTHGLPSVMLGSIKGGSFVVHILNTHGANALYGTLKIAFTIS